MYQFLAGLGQLWDATWIALQPYETIVYIVLLIPLGFFIWLWIGMSARRHR